ncbi:MAG: hypothetical protein J5828_04200, partial [Desulfovibrionaceae bacterium]|nr:hypothetical protein [Desulfovibrionaceae bacterium]
QAGGDFLPRGGSLLQAGKNAVLPLGRHGFPAFRLIFMDLRIIFETKGQQRTRLHGINNLTWRLLR